MTDLWLGVIAVALFVLTLSHVLTLVKVAQLVKQQSAVAREVRKELTPLIAKANRIVDDAGRVSALALTQMERVDRVFDLTAMRLDDTLQTVQEALIKPVRQGAAVMAGVRAALAVFKARQDRVRYDRDDEDALFIG